MEFKEKTCDVVLSPTMDAYVKNSSSLHPEGNFDEITNIKYKIMKMLTSDGDILRTLHNTELEKYVPTLYDPKYMNDPKLDKQHNGDVYIDTNVFNFLRIPDIASDVKTYIGFEVDDVEIPDFNTSRMTRNITFRTVSYKEESKTKYGIRRQDLLALLIRNKFNWTNKFGLSVHTICNQGKLLESGYYYRDIILNMTATNDTYDSINNAGVV